MKQPVHVTRIRRGVYALTVPGQRPELIEGTRREAYARAGQLRQPFHADRPPRKRTKREAS